MSHSQRMLLIFAAWVVATLCLLFTLPYDAPLHWLIGARP